MQASFVLCVFRRLTNHHNNMSYSSPLLKKTWVRQVVLDNWFPLILGPDPGQVLSFGRVKLPKTRGTSQNTSPWKETGCKPGPRHKISHLSGPSPWNVQVYTYVYIYI